MEWVGLERTERAGNGKQNIPMAADEIFTWRREDVSEVRLIVLGTEDFTSERLCWYMAWHGVSRA